MNFTPRIPSLPSFPDLPGLPGNALTRQVGLRVGPIVLETLVKHYIEKIRREFGKDAEDEDEDENGDGAQEDLTDAEVKGTPAVTANEKDDGSKRRRKAFGRKSERTKEKEKEEKVQLRKDELVYDEIFTIVKAFLEAASYHTVESLQSFSNTRTPAPPSVRVVRVRVPQSCCDEAAKLLIKVFGGEDEMRKIVGGVKWWQVRGVDGVDAQWITAKKDWAEAKAKSKKAEQEKAERRKKMTTPTSTSKFQSKSTASQAPAATPSKAKTKATQSKSQQSSSTKPPSSGTLTMDASRFEESSSSTTHAPAPSATSSSAMTTTTTTSPASPASPSSSAVSTSAPSSSIAPASPRGPNPSPGPARSSSETRTGTRTESSQAGRTTLSSDSGESDANVDGGTDKGDEGAERHLEAGAREGLGDARTDTRARASLDTDADTDAEGSGGAETMAGEADDDTVKDTDLRDRDPDLENENENANDDETGAEHAEMDEEEEEAEENDDDDDDDDDAGEEEDKDPKPCVLYIHGGGYYFGSVDQERYSIQRYARKIGGRVFAINYRLAPQYPFPCALQDLLAAYIYLTSPPPHAPHAHKPINPAHIVVAGDSAGGGLVLALLMVLRDLRDMDVESEDERDRAGLDGAGKEGRRDSVEKRKEGERMPEVTVKDFATDPDAEGAEDDTANGSNATSTKQTPLSKSRHENSTKDSKNQSPPSQLKSHPSYSSSSSTPTSFPSTPPLPAGAVLISPWCDLTHSFPSIHTNTDTDVIPAWGLGRHRPSVLWPPPEPETTTRVKTGIRERVGQAIRAHVPNLNVNAPHSHSLHGRGSIGSASNVSLGLGQSLGTPGTIRGDAGANGIPGTPGGGNGQLLGAGMGVGGLEVGNTTPTPAPNPFDEYDQTIRIPLRGHSLSGATSHSPVPNGANSSTSANTYSNHSPSSPGPAPPTSSQTTADATFEDEYLTVTSQIQLYAPNTLLTHPLVSPALGYLGGLCPLFIVASESEVLRDEIVYLAHKAAHPELYPVKESARAMYPPLKGAEERYARFERQHGERAKEGVDAKGKSKEKVIRAVTPVHLQIYDALTTARQLTSSSSCDIPVPMDTLIDQPHNITKLNHSSILHTDTAHVLPVLFSFTTPAKYCFRAMAAFTKHVTGVPLKPGYDKRDKEGQPLPGHSTRRYSAQEGSEQRRGPDGSKIGLGLGLGSRFRTPPVPPLSPGSLRSPATVTSGPPTSAKSGSLPNPTPSSSSDANSDLTPSANLSPNPKSSKTPRSPRSMGSLVSPRSPKSPRSSKDPDSISTNDGGGTSFLRKAFSLSATPARSHRSSQIPSEVLPVAAPEPPVHPPAGLEPRIRSPQSQSHPNSTSTSVSGSSITTASSLNNTNATTTISKSNSDLPVSESRDVLTASPLPTSPLPSPGIPASPSGKSTVSLLAMPLAETPATLRTSEPVTPKTSRPPSQSGSNTVRDVDGDAGATENKNSREFAERYAGDPIVYSQTSVFPSMHSNMIRERVSTRGIIRPLEPPHLLPALTIAPNLIGEVSELALRRYIDAQAYFDKKFRHVRKAVERERKKKLERAGKDIDRTGKDVVRGMSILQGGLEKEREKARGKGTGRSKSRGRASAGVASGSGLPSLQAALLASSGWSWAWALDANERPPPSSLVARRDTEEALKLARVADQAVLQDDVYADDDGDYQDVNGEEDELSPNGQEGTDARRMSGNNLWSIVVNFLTLGPDRAIKEKRKERKERKEEVRDLKSGNDEKERGRARAVQR